MDERRKAGLLRRAARLALGARPSPNPRVGAVLVRGGRVVAEGRHERAGGDHAEVAAIRAAGGRAAGCDLVVTLEPCCTTGRTPPCTDAILRAGIRRVHAGAPDPNPRVAGRGIARLRAAGVETTVAGGAPRALCERLVEEWARWITTGLPFVRVKAAVSLDGRIAAAGGDARWISNERSRREAHRMRARADAVMVGVGTVLRDDPLLTVRGVGWKGPAPARVVVDSRLRTPAGSRLARSAGEAPVIVAHTEGDGAALRAMGVELLRCAPDAQGRVDLADLVRRLGAREVTSILVEGGSALVTSLLARGLADALTLFVAPLLIGGAGAVPLVAGRAVDRVADALRLKDVRARRMGEDVVIEGRIGSSLTK